MKQLKLSRLNTVEETPLEEEISLICQRKTRLLMMYFVTNTQEEIVICLPIFTKEYFIPINKLLLFYITYHNVNISLLIRFSYNTLQEMNHTIICIKKWFTHSVLCLLEKVFQASTSEMSIIIHSTYSVVS